MLLTFFLICIVLGALTGFLAGLLGIGGGLLIVPALVYLLPLLDIAEELIMTMALATSLATIIITSTAAAYAHHKNNNIPWPIARVLMLFMAIGALLGAFIATILSAKTLTLFFSITVSLLALNMIFSTIRNNTTNINENTCPPNKFSLRLLGVFTGAVSSLMGIAGGAILIPLLSYLKTPLRKAIGVATICGVMVAVFGSLGYVVSGYNESLLPPWSLGYIYLPALLGLTLTSSLFAPYGVNLAKKLPVIVLKRLFACFLIIVAVQMMR